MEYLAETLGTIGYTPIYSDPDVWIRIALNTSGFE